MANCCVLKSLFFSAWAIWAVWITIFIRRIYYTNLKNLLNPDVKFFSNQIVGRRYDVVNIDLIKFTLIGIFLLPFRLTIVVLSIFIEYIWCRILGITYGSKDTKKSVFLIFLVTLKEAQKATGPIYIYLTSLIFRIAGNVMFAAIGFRLKHFRHSIYSFEPNYKNSQKNRLPGVVVCNHTSFLDIFILFMKKMSFLSKEAVGKAPIFGTFAIDRQCTFVNRDESKDKERVL